MTKTTNTDADKLVSVVMPCCGETYFVPAEDLEAWLLIDLCPHCFEALILDEYTL